MCISLRHHRRLMPQNPLDLVQVHTGLHHASRTGMAQIMEPKIQHLTMLQSANRETPSKVFVARGVRAVVVNTNSESMRRLLALF